jgi:dihydroorotate dehydrogenase (fumarate)
LKVAFANNSLSSINSYGYSPHPLATYLSWIEEIIRSDPGSRKPFIVSVTASTAETLSTMLDAIQVLRAEYGGRIAVELNTSCPNIMGSGPPAYDFTSLSSALTVLAEHYKLDHTLTIGLKLPPYVYASQFDSVIQGISDFTYSTVDGIARNPFSFLTSTNTLGNSLLFADQTTPEPGPNNATNPSAFAVPPALGGLAGESIHALSLGNVYTFTKLLGGASDEALKRIVVIGVGGVTTPEAVQRMRKAGAKVVACATLFGREGVGAFEKLSKA